MASQKKPETLARQIASGLLSEKEQSPPILELDNANDGDSADVERMKFIFQLQEEQAERQFERQLTLLDRQLKLEAQTNTNTERDRKLSHKLEVEKLQLYFKMFVATACLLLGTVFVLTNHENMGYFLLGGALSAVTSGVVGLMRTSKT